MSADHKTPALVFGIDRGSLGFTPAIRARVRRSSSLHTVLELDSRDLRFGVRGELVFYLGGKACGGRVVQRLNPDTYEVDLDPEPIAHFGVTEVVW